MGSYDTLSRDELRVRAAAYDEAIQRFDIAPADDQLIGKPTIFFLILNRTVGSGIFTVPFLVLRGTHSLGSSFLIWAGCGIIVLCGACCWLELGLSVPRVSVKEDGVDIRVAAPRSGGEKNFLGYICKKPRLFIQCVYGIMYIIFGNISGNAIAFGMYIMIAAGKSPSDPKSGYHKGAIYGLAVGALSICAFLHIFSRRGGLLANNIFGLYKLLLLIVLIIFGWVYAGGKLLQSNTPAGQPPPKVKNFQNTLSGRSHDFASVVNSILASLFSYTGFEQPFYILSEVKNPKRNFPRATLTAVYTTIVLYILTNISYMLVVPVDEAYPSNPELDIAGRMLEILFDDSSTDSAARRTAAGLIALSILGNILVMTFTAARVKQEIAKEGIIPCSLFFASGYTTPWAKLMQARRSTQQANTIRINNVDVDDPLEQSPIPALILHWFTSLFLVAIFAWTEKPSTAYIILISLYSYTNVCVIGFLVSSGLLYLKIDSWVRGANGRNWANKAQWKPYLDPLPNIIFFLSTTFLVVSAIAPVRSEKSPFLSKTIGYPTWVVSIVGLTSLLWGVIWWGLLKFHERNRKRKLVVARVPYLVQDDDREYIQKVELVTHDWEPYDAVSRFEVR